MRIKIEILLPVASTDYETFEVAINKLYRWCAKRDNIGIDVAIRKVNLLAPEIFLSWLETMYSEQVKPDLLVVSIERTGENDDFKYIGDLITPDKAVQLAAYQITQSAKLAEQVPVTLLSNMASALLDLDEMLNEAINLKVKGKAVEE